MTVPPWSNGRGFVRRSLDKVESACLMKPVRSEGCPVESGTFYRIFPVRRLAFAQITVRNFGEAASGLEVTESSDISTSLPSRAIFLLSSSTAKAGFPSRSAAQIYPLPVALRASARGSPWAVGHTTNSKNVTLDFIKRIPNSRFVTWVFFVDRSANRVPHHRRIKTGHWHGEVKMMLSLLCPVRSKFGLRHGIY